MSNKNQYSAFYGYCNQAELIESERLALVKQVSKERTSSVKELSLLEYNRLVQAAQAIEKEKNQKMRSRLIYCLTQLGYKQTNFDGSPNFEKMQEWIKEKTGGNNPKKKNLFKLNHTELQGCVKQVNQFFNQKFGAKAV